MIKIVSIILIIGSFMSNLAFGDCTNAVTPVTEGQTVPCTGDLFTPAAEKANRKKLMAGDLAAKQVTALQNENAQKDIQIKDLTTAVGLETQKSDAFSKEATNQADIAQKALAADSRDKYIFAGVGAVSIIVIEILLKKATSINF